MNVKICNNVSIGRKLSGTTKSAKIHSSRPSNSSNIITPEHVSENR